MKTIIVYYSRRGENLEEYSRIYLGYPNYWGTMPAPVFSFLEQSDLSGKEIWPFCTYEDGGFGHSLEDLKRVCPASVIAEGLSMRGAEVGSGLTANASSRSEIESWLKENGVL